MDSNKVRKSTKRTVFKLTNRYKMQTTAFLCLIVTMTSSAIPIKYDRDQRDSVNILTCEESKNFKGKQWRKCSQEGDAVPYDHFKIPDALINNRIPAFEVPDVK